MVQVNDSGNLYKFFTCSQRIIEALRFIKDKGEFPFTATLARVNNSGRYPEYEFT